MADLQPESESEQEQKLVKRQVQKTGVRPPLFKILPLRLRSPSRLASRSVHMHNRLWGFLRNQVEVITLSFPHRL